MHNMPLIQIRDDLVMNLWAIKQYLIRSEHSEQCPKCKSHTLQQCSSFKVFIIGPLPIFAYRFKKVAICAKCRARTTANAKATPKLNKQVVLTRYLGAFLILGLSSFLMLRI